MASCDDNRIRNLVQMLIFSDSCATSFTFELASITIPSQPADWGGTRCHFLDAVFVE